MTDLKPFTYVLCRDSGNECWRVDILVRYDKTENLEFPYIGFRSTWKYCIPYKGNEHLADTTGDTYNPELGDIVRYRYRGDKTFIGIIHKIDGTLITVVPIQEDHLCIINIDIKDILYKIDQ